MEIKLKDSVHFVKRKETILLYSNEEGQLFKTDGVGAFILELIKEGISSRDQLIEKLSLEFPNIDKKELSLDLDDFLNQLKEQCLLK